MKISKETEKKILADKEQLSVQQIAKKYKLSQNEVEKIIQNSTKATPKWFYGVLVSLPIIFLILLEIFLRIINYGVDVTQWVDAGEGKYVINPSIGKKYFTSKLITDAGFTPVTVEDVFDQTKKENAFRVFVLGESSAEGYPFSPMGSFSRYIRRRLELTYPHTHIEVVNIGMTAVSSYTLLDLIPGVLDQKPDLILIYTGHNEYYGAFGVGSIETAGSSRSLIKLVIYLNNFKITQLLRNSINSVLSLFSSENKVFTGTLMSNMAKDQSVTFNSKTYNAGLDQFKENMTEILEMIKSRGVPVIVGKLVSNLKDQKPFVSVNTAGYKNADQLFEEAQVAYNKFQFGKADSLFRLAKDLDALRFRAPEKTNYLIDQLGKQLNIPTVSIDSIFCAESSGGIVGDNLIVDHIHPNIKGHQLIGKAFYEVMERNKYLPKTENAKISFNKQDSVTCANFVFSTLDSTMGNYNIRILKSSWPYVKEKSDLGSIDFSKILKPHNYLDTIALLRATGKVMWADAQLMAATYYLRNDDIKNYLKHMNILLYQYPIFHNYNTMVNYFFRKNKINAADYTYKRQGLIALQLGQYEEALKLLTQASIANPKDASILYNLALAYHGDKDNTGTLLILDYYLKMKPTDKNALELKKRVLSGK